MAQQMVLTLKQTVLTYTIETDGRQADANQHMVLTHTIETDVFDPCNRNRWSHNSRATPFVTPGRFFCLRFTLPLYHYVMLCYVIWLFVKRLSQEAIQRRSQRDRLVKIKVLYSAPFI